MDKKRKIIVIVCALVLAGSLAAGAAVFGAVRSRRAEPLICLDAGHGGSDTGAAAGDRLEKDDNLRMTLAVGNILEKKGCHVIYTREDDSFLSLEERYTFSNKKKATVFVAIHRNSAESKTANGIEAWIKNTAPLPDKRLAGNILDQLDRVGFGSNRGVCAGYRGDKTKNYAVNSGTKCKSCLLELGFLTNADDNERFDKNFDAYAAAIARGIMQSL